VISAYLFDTGPLQVLPGIAEDFRYSLLPFWGNHCLVDFMIANFRGSADDRDTLLRTGHTDGNGNGNGRGKELSETELTIVLEESHRTIPLALSSRWRKTPVRVVALEDPLAELLSLVESSRSETVILASLSCVCVLDPAALLEAAATAAGRIIKISISRTPIDMYAAGRQTIVSLLRSALERRTERKPLRESLFASALLPSMDLLEEVPGEVLFQNNLMEYFHSNLWVIGNCATDGYRRILSRLPELSDKGAESYIREKGCVRNSWLASGVEVEGDIEESILFPNVHIGKNTRVSKSIVMNGNRIGAGGDIQNSLLLPFSAELSRATTNVGDNCSIGSRSSIARNVDFPGQIRDGLTVVGMNSEIPAGLRVEAGVCIGAGVPASLLRKMKTVKKGTCVFKPGNPDAKVAEPSGKSRR
jgi:carbonic anhydrase/acetyltransferase-like protein (isoleucine patch superfamily)